MMAVALAGLAGADFGGPPDSALGAPAKASSPKPRAQRIKARITDVTDGDTLRIRAYGAKRKSYRVRLIGIDTPETVDAGSPVECGGPQATDAMLRLAFTDPWDSDGDGLLDEAGGSGRRVTLITDPSQDLYDYYGRLLAYVVRSDGTDLGARQLGQGWAEVYVFDKRFRRYHRFQAAEDRAHAANRGVWGLCGGDFHQEAEAPAPPPPPPPAPVAPTPTPTPSPSPSPTPSCNANYSGACLPLTGDVDCGEISARDFYVVGEDVFALDADGDGLACES
jgi:micrococcal nuclease